METTKIFDDILKMEKHIKKTKNVFIILLTLLVLCVVISILILNPDTLEKAITTLLFNTVTLINSFYIYRLTIKNLTYQYQQLQNIKKTKEKYITELKMPEEINNEYITELIIPEGIIKEKSEETSIRLGLTNKKPTN